MVVLTVILEMGVVPVKESIAPIMAIVVRFFLCNDDVVVVCMRFR